MKNWKKVFAMISAATLTVSALAGCGSQTSGSTEANGAVAETGEALAEEGNAVSNKDVDVVVVWTNGASEKAVRERQVKEFNETTGKEKGIEIQYTVYGDGYEDTLNLAVQSGETVDLFKISNNNLVTDYIDSGYILAIDDMPGGEELLAEYEGMLTPERETFNDKAYMLPWGINTYKFVINVDLFEKAGLTEEDYPTTWSEMRECARKITETGNGEYYGYGLSLSALWTIGSYYAQQSFVNTGHMGYDPVTMQYRYTDYAPSAKALYDIVQDGSVFPGYETLDADGVRAQFAAGKIGIMGGASFDPGVYKDQFPAECNWTVIDPVSDTDEAPKYKEGLAVSDSFAIGAAAASHKEAVMEVFKFFHSDECAAELYEEGLLMPFRQSAIDLATKEPDIPGYAEFATVENGIPTVPTPDKCFTVEGISFNELIANYLTGQAGDRDSIDAQLQELEDKYNAGLETVDPEIRSHYKYEDGATPER